MRITAACVVLALGAGTAVGQFTTPGTPVGSGSGLGPAAGGQSNPSVGAPVGGQVGSGVGGVPEAGSQDFSKIDKSRLAAPLPEFPGIGGGPTFWDRAKDRVWGAMTFWVPSTTPAPRPPWVPGISRRNRERAEERMWRRD